MIEWKQMNQFNRASHVDFTNPDLVMYAEIFGAQGFRVERTEDLMPVLREAIASDTLCVIDCLVDYRENIKLTEKLGNLISPL